MSQSIVISFLLGLSLLLYGCSTPEEAPHEPSSGLGKAIMLIWDGKPGQAADLAETILADLPAPQTYEEVTYYGDTLVVLCEAQTALRRYYAAEESCLKALDIFETQLGDYQRQAPLAAYDQLFAVYEAAGIRRDSIDAELAVRQRYLKRLPIQPMLIVPRIDTLTRVGDLHRSSGDWRASEAAYREAIDLTGQLPQYHYSDADLKPCRHLSRLYRERGDAAAAETALELCEKR